MTQGLSVSDVVQVDVNLSPTAATVRSFGSLLLLGASPVLSTAEGLRGYTNLDGVAADFSGDDPEYVAAERFFAQSPKPTQLFIGRWAREATKGSLYGGLLTADEQAISNFANISDGALTISINGTEQDLTGLDLSGQTTLNGVAAIIEDEFAGNVSLIWNAPFNRFEILSGTSGEDSTVGFAQPASSGTDLGPLLKLTANTASSSGPGHEQESLTDAVERVTSESADWYGLLIADPNPTDDQIVQVAGIIEATAPFRIFGVTVAESAALDRKSDTDLGARLSAGNFARTFWQYSNVPYAAASLFGRAFTVDFSAQATTLTLKFKQEPGVVAESLNETQARAIDAKHGNVYVRYANGTSIIQQGVMANGDYFDERHGLDWLQNYAQTNLFNLLYQSQTKVPQTDSGVNRLLTNVEASMDQSVTNGLVAAGTWTSDTVFGTLATGDTLTKGYYCYAPPVADQSQADRERRKAPPIQVALKFAGAVHSANVIINVNR